MEVIKFIYMYPRLAHFGLIMITSVGRPIIDIAIEYCTGKIVQSGKGYLAYQIDMLCEKNKIVDDSYAARVNGYYSIEQTIERLEKAKSTLAEEIKFYAYKLYTDDDFIVLDLDSTGKDSNDKPEAVGESSLEGQIEGQPDALP